MESPFFRRHIQNMSEASELQAHWGYADRALPCTSDAGTCEYLDAVYWMHDVSMLYTFILWAVIGGILAIWMTLRLIAPGKSILPAQGSEALPPRPRQSSVYRTWRSLWALARQSLLPEFLPNWFGHTSRLQVAILACLCAYLTVFSFVGIVYKTWVTPVKNTPGAYNTRVTMGGFSDRIGALAYALTPFTILLSTRESILSLLTGIPYQHFNFLHRWLGRIIFVQAFIHTLIWTVIEARLYQPQPKIWNDFVGQQYIVFGIVAMIFITYLIVFSTKWCIRLTGYEFFRNTHYLIGVLYIAMCWGHWTKLACWMIASLGLIGIDRGARLCRSALLHAGWLKGKGGFQCAQANMTYFEAAAEDSAVVRLDFAFSHDGWLVGQHFFLCFPELTVWQSHPFTPATVPAPHPASPQHTYIIRAFRGETARLADLAADKNNKTMSVILTGPYGNSVLGEPEWDRDPPHNVLAIAGGTGISFSFPVILQACRRNMGALELVWIVRRTHDLRWIAPELLKLKKSMGEGWTQRLKIRLFVTRDSFRHSKASLPVSEDAVAHIEKESSMRVEQCDGHGKIDPLEGLLLPQSNFEVTWLADHHPTFDTARHASVLDDFIERASGHGGRILVAGSGPPGLGTDLKAAVAAKNKASRVLRGDESADVEMRWDDRLTM